MFYPGGDDHSVLAMREQMEALRPQQVRILSVGIVRASDDSCNNAVKDERAGATAGLLQRRHKQPVAYTAAWRT